MMSQTGMYANPKSNIDWKGFDFEDRCHYALDGEVKDVSVKVSWDSESRSIEGEYKARLVFNSKGDLVKKYEVEKDGDPFLEEEYYYNSNNQLVYKKESDKKFGSLGNGMVGYLGGVHIQETKYVFDEKGKHTHTYFKSSYQDDFFLKERNTYNSMGVLIKSESINNHFPDTERFYRTCKGGGVFLNDFIVEYYYNLEGLNILVKKYKYEGIRYEKKTIEGREITVPILREEDEDYFPGYKLENESRISYNRKKQVDSILNISYSSLNREPVETKTVKKYDVNNKVILTKRINNYGGVSGSFKEYQVVKGNVIIKTSGYFTERNDKLEKRIDYTVVLQVDGNLRRSNYKDGELESIWLYDSNFNLIEDRDPETGEKVKIFYKYDSKQNWIEKKTIQQDVGYVEVVKRTITYH